MTVPESVYELESMRAVLEARGDDATGPWSCPGCGRTDLEPEALACTDALPGELPRFICHACASGPHRMARALQEAQAIAARAAAGEHDWSDVRGRRTLLLAMCDWTQMPDAELSETMREAWRAYRSELRAITDTSPSPDAVVWPNAPS